MADRRESASDITVSIDSPAGKIKDFVVERLSATKNIDIQAIYGSGQMLPDGYSINQISYEGTIELQGNKYATDEHMFDNNGIPHEFTITITHMNGNSTVFTECLATSDGYEMNSGETTTTTYEFVAMGKETDGQPDKNP